MTDDINGTQIASLNDDPIIINGIRNRLYNSNNYSLRQQLSNKQNTPQIINNDNPYLPIIGGLLGAGLGAAIPFALHANPYITATGALMGGIGTAGALHSGQVSGKQFQNYKNQFINDENIPQQFKDYIQNANSYEQINNVIEKLAPQMGKFNMSNSQAQQLQGASNSEAFNPSNYYDPTEMTSYIQNVSMKPLTKGILPQGLNYQGTNPYGSKAPIQQNPYFDGGTSKVIVPQLDILNNTPQTESMPQVDENGNAVFNAGVKKQNFDFGDYNPYAYMSQPGYYNEAIEQQFKQNPQTNMQAYHAQQLAEGQKAKNPYIPADMESKINNKNMETKLAPQKVAISKQNADTASGRLSLSQKEFQHKLDHPPKGSKNSITYGDDLAEYYEILGTNDKNKINYARQQFIKLHDLDPDNELKENK